MASSKTVSGDCHLYFIPDESLQKLLTHMEGLLGNASLIEVLPDHGRHIEKRKEILLREIHSRKFWICLEELHEWHHYRQGRKGYVDEWMRKYDENNQDNTDIAILDLRQKRKYYHRELRTEYIQDWVENFNEDEQDNPDTPRPLKRRHSCSF